jgi:hypothetical protein
MNGFAGVGATPKRSTPKKDSSDKNKISIKVKASGPVAKQVAPMARKVAQTMTNTKVEKGSKIK